MAQLAVLVIGAGQQQGITQAGSDGQPGQDEHQLRVLIRLTAGNQQHPAQHHHQTTDPAGQRIELALIAQGLTVIPGYVQLLTLGLLDEAVKEQRRRQNQQGHQIIENAALCKARVIKGHLILQPAEEHTEGARSADIAGNFQRFFLHNFVPVSITMD